MASIRNDILSGFRSLFEKTITIIMANIEMQHATKPAPVGNNFIISVK